MRTFVVVLAVAVLAPLSSAWAQHVNRPHHGDGVVIAPRHGGGHASNHRSSAPSHGDDHRQTNSGGHAPSHSGGHGYGGGHHSGGHHSGGHR